jgi:methyl-accepting chemotaxis protein
MAQWLTWLLTIDTDVDEARRRGRHVVILALGLLVMVLLFVPVILFNSSSTTGLWIVSMAGIVIAGALLLARRGYVTAGGLILIATIAIATLGSSANSGKIGITPFYTLLGVLIAGLVLRPWQIWATLGAYVSALVLVCLALPQNPFNEPLGYSVLTGAPLMLGMVTLIGFLSAHSTETAIRTARQAQATAEDTAAALELRIAAEQVAQAEAKRLQRAEIDSRMELERTVAEYLAFVQQVARGDLAQRLDVTQHGALGQLGEGLNGMAGSLHQMTCQIQEANNAIAAAAAEILAATTQQAASAAEQSAAITQTATTVEEVKVIAQQTAQQASQVARDGEVVLSVARQGSQAVETTVQGMEQIRVRVETIAQSILTLSEQTQAIGMIIATVNDLADQSNLLALNAAIEAARAGEQGRSFAVVAQHVRGLAERSKAATAQVRGILSEIQKAAQDAVLVTEEGTKGVANGTTLAAQTGQVIHRIAQEIEGGAQANVQMAAAAQQQTAGMEQIGQAMSSMQQATAQVSSSTRQVERAARDLHTLAQSLQRTIAAYQL